MGGDREGQARGRGRAVGRRRPEPQSDRSGPVADYGADGQHQWSGQQVDRRPLILDDRSRTAVATRNWTRGPRQQEPLNSKVPPARLEHATRGLGNPGRAEIDMLRARQGISTQLIARAEPELFGEVKQALYRIGQEALWNAVKHACPGMSTSAWMRIRTRWIWRSPTTRGVRTQREPSRTPGLALYARASDRGRRLPGDR